MLDALLLIVILIVLILIHEAGHFSIAKLSGARVDEFGFGFPPKLFGFKKGETEYTVNAIPFGGFVRIYGEDPEDEGAQKNPRSFINQPKGMQAATIAAGVAGNFLLAWLLFSTALSFGLPMPADRAPESAAVSESRVVVTSVLPDAPAAVSGIEPGDAIQSLEAGGETLATPTVDAVQFFISRHANEEITIAYRRAGEIKEAHVIPARGVVDGMPAIGIAMDTVATVSVPWYRAPIDGAVMTGKYTVAVLGAFGTLLVNAVTGAPSLSTLTGPVGIAGIVGDAAEFGFAYLLSFVGLISVNLAVLNLIPFPALDGGRLLFLGIEVVKGSPVDSRFAHYAHLIGFALLILLMIIVTYNDIVRLL